MTIVMLAGKKCSGKNTVADVMRQILEYQGKKVQIIGFSDSVGSMLSSFKLPLARRNYSTMCTALKNVFGPDVLRRAVRQRLRPEFDVAIVHGLRFAQDTNLSLSDTRILVGIYASDEVRHKRACAGGKDGTVSLEAFLAQDRAETEGDIDALLEIANYTIINNESVRVLRQQVSDILDLMS